jgi:hypothetical protein
MLLYFLKMLTRLSDFSPIGQFMKVAIFWRDEIAPKMAIFWGDIKPSNIIKIL